MRVCLSSVESLALYCLYGLEPGGFCTSLLLGDRDTAFHRAHMTIRPIVEDMFLFVDKYIPQICRGSQSSVNKWVFYDGLYGAYPKDQMIFKLQMPGNWLHPYILEWKLVDCLLDG